MVRTRATHATVALLVLGLVGCGQPFHVVTEPRAADVFVDGEYVGNGSVLVRTNGVVFSTYHVEARAEDGRVLDARDVEVAYGTRSATLLTFGLIGLIPPLFFLLPLLPASFFVGDVEPDHVHLRAPNEARPAPPPPDTIDRPVLDLREPRPGQRLRVPASGKVVLAIKGRARHWSGVRAVTVLVDEREVAWTTPRADADIELVFNLEAPLPGPGSHLVRVVATGVRGSAAVEDVQVTALKEGESPPAPEKVPGLDPVEDPGEPRAEEPR